MSASLFHHGDNEPSTEYLSQVVSAYHLSLTPYHSPSRHHHPIRLTPLVRHRRPQPVRIRLLHTPIAHHQIPLPHMQLLGPSHARVRRHRKQSRPDRNPIRRYVSIAPKDNLPPVL